MFAHRCHAALQHSQKLFGLPSVASSSLQRRNYQRLLLDPMADKFDSLAHGTATQGRTMLSAHLGRLENYPLIKAKLESHAREKDAQLDRLERIVDHCGESRSLLKDATGSIIATVSTLASTGSDDEVIKNGFAAISMARFGAAAYETLIILAEAAGEASALRPLQQSLSEERSMAAFFEENLRPTVVRFLQLQSAAVEASH